MAFFRGSVLSEIPIYTLIMTIITGLSTCHSFSISPSVDMSVRPDLFLVQYFIYT